MCMQLTTEFQMHRVIIHRPGGSHRRHIVIDGDFIFFQWLVEVDKISKNTSSSQFDLIIDNYRTLHGRNMFLLKNNILVYNRFSQPSLFS